MLISTWWQRSEAAKAALRELLKAGTVSLDAGGMLDELQSADLAFVPADHSDSCTAVSHAPCMQPKKTVGQDKAAMDKYYVSVLSIALGNLLCPGHAISLIRRNCPCL